LVHFSACGPFSYRSFSGTLHCALRVTEKLLGFRSEAVVLCTSGQEFLHWPSGAREGRAPWIGRPRGELRGSEVAQARMRAFPIVFNAPLFDLDPRIRERNEDLLIKAFFAQPRVETMCAFWIGLPGSMNCNRTPWS
jgi:hypothetical protein